MSIPVDRCQGTSSNAQARQGPSEHVGAQDDTPLVIGGDLYLSPGDAIDRLGESLPHSPLGLYQKLKNAVRAGDVRAVKVHPKMNLYHEADVIELRARLLARG